MEKQNDWLATLIYQPDLKITDLSGLGITPDNTGFKDKSYYESTEIVQKLFKDDSGKFNKAKFDTFYNNSILLYNKYAEDYDTEYMAKTKDEFDIYTPHEERKHNSINIEKINNPLGAAMGIEGFNIQSDPKKTIEELAQSQKVFDSSTNKFLDWTPEDKGGWFSGITMPTLAYAVYDKDTEEVDEYGNVSRHRKGDYKFNSEGMPYTELMGDKDLTGRKIVSYFDILSKENGMWNTVDVFDSDDVEKSLAGSIALNVIKIAPMFIPYVGAVYGAAGIVTELAKLFPVVTKSVNGLIGNDNSNSEFVKSLNSMESWGKKFDVGVSKYSQDNMWTAENLLGVVGSISGQLFQQKLLQKIPKLFNKADSLGNVKLGRNLALGYMAGTSNLEVYSQFKEAGATDRVAGMASLASMGVLFGLMNNDYYKDFLFGDGKLKEPIKQFIANNQKLLKAGEVAAKTSKAASAKWYTQVGDSFKTMFMSMKGNSKYVTASLAEAGEEVSEEMSVDLIKGMFSGLGALGIGNELDFKFTAQDAFNRYAMAAVGGAIGGPLFEMQNTVESHWDNKKKENKNAPENDYLKNKENDDAVASLLPHIIAGRTPQLIKRINSERKKGKFGSTVLSTDSEIIIDKNNSTQLIYKSVDDTHKSQNDVLADNLISLVNKLDTLLKVEGFTDKNDKLNIPKSKLNSMGITIGLGIIQTGANKILAQEYQNIAGQIIKTQAELSSAVKKSLEGTSLNKTDININDIAKTDENVKHLQDKLNELRQSKEDLLEGKMNQDIVGRMFFRAIPELLNRDKGSFTPHSVKSYAKLLRNIDYDILTKEEKENINKEYLAYEKDNSTKYDEKYKLLKNVSSFINENLDLTHFKTGEEKPSTLQAVMLIEDIEKTLQLINNSTITKEDRDKAILHLKTLDEKFSKFVKYYNEFTTDDALKITYTPLTENSLAPETNAEFADILSKLSNNVEFGLQHKQATGFEFADDLIDYVEAGNKINDDQIKVIISNEDLLVSLGIKHENLSKKEVFNNFKKYLEDNNYYDTTVPVEDKILQLIQNFVNKTENKQLIGVLENIYDYFKSKGTSDFILTTEQFEDFQYIIRSIYLLKDVLKILEVDNDKNGITITLNSLGESIFPELKQEDVINLQGELDNLLHKLAWLERISLFNEQNQLKEEKNIVIQGRTTFFNTWMGENIDDIFELPEKLITDKEELSTLINTGINEENFSIFEEKMIIFESNIFKHIQSKDKNIIALKLIELFPDAHRLRTSKFNSNISKDTLSEYDSLMYLLKTISLNSSEFYGKLNELTTSKAFDKYLLYSQEYAVQLALAKHNESDLFNKVLFVLKQQLVDATASNPELQKGIIAKPVMTNANAIFGSTGVGKTTAIGKLLYLMLKDDTNVLSIGPFETQTTTFNTVLNTPITYKDKDSLFTEIFENYNDLIYDDTVGIIKRNENDTLTDVDLNTYIKSDSPIKNKTLFIDEITHFNIVELELLNNWSVKYNINLVFFGDLKQNGKTVTVFAEDSKGAINKTQESKTVDDVFIVKTPQISVNLRSSSKAKYDNFIDLSNIVSAFFDRLEQDAFFKDNTVEAINDYNEIVGNFNNIVFKYKETENGLFGEKVVKSNEVDDYIKKFKSWGGNFKIITNNLSKYSAYPDDIITPDNVQGLDYDYIILDIVPDPNDSWKNIKNLYTLTQRSRKGSILISDKWGTLKSTEDSYGDVNKLPNAKNIKDYGEWRMKAISKFASVIPVTPTLSSITSTNIHTDTVITPTKNLIEAPIIPLKPIHEPGTEQSIIKQNSHLNFIRLNYYGKKHKVITNLFGDKLTDIEYKKVVNTLLSIYTYHHTEILTNEQWDHIKTYINNNDVYNTLKNIVDTSDKIYIINNSIVHIELKDQLLPLFQTNYKGKDGRFKLKEINSRINRAEGSQNTEEWNIKDLDKYGFNSNELLCVTSTEENLNKVGESITPETKEFLKINNGKTFMPISFDILGDPTIELKSSEDETKGINFMSKTHRFIGVQKKVKQRNITINGISKSNRIYDFIIHLVNLASQSNNGLYFINRNNNSTNFINNHQVRNILKSLFISNNSDIQSKIEKDLTNILIRIKTRGTGKHKITGIVVDDKIFTFNNENINEVFTDSSVNEFINAISNAKSDIKLNESENNYAINADLLWKLIGIDAIATRIQETGEWSDEWKTLFDNLETNMQYGVYLNIPIDRDQSQQTVITNDMGLASLSEFFKKAEVEVEKGYDYTAILGSDILDMTFNIEVQPIIEEVKPLVNNELTNFLNTLINNEDYNSQPDIKTMIEYTYNNPLWNENTFLLRSQLFTDYTKISTETFKEYLNMNPLLKELIESHLELMQYLLC